MKNRNGSKSKTKKICYNCKKTKSTEKSVIKQELSQWKKNMDLKTHYPNDENAKLKIDYPKKFNTVHELSLGKKFAKRYVYYYCAENKSMNDCLKPQYVSDAYGKKFKNKGVAISNSEGDVKLKLICPQSYYVDLNKLHMSHLHYFISDKNNKSWDNKLYTERIVCNVSKNELKNIIQNNCAIIINALPFEEFIKNRVPNSISIPYNLVTEEKISESELVKYLSFKLEEYPRINKLVKEKKLDIKNIPIVVYCYNKECNASDLLIEKMIEYGFKDLKEYSGGIVDWLK